MDPVKYIEKIKNFHKHEYAKAYWRYLTKGGDEPSYQCSYMAAQAVRANLIDGYRWMRWKGKTEGI